MDPTSSIPPLLEKVMKETMVSAIVSLYQKYSWEAIKKIFNERVLQSPFEESLSKQIHLDENPLLAKRIQYLHALYNKPDETSRASSINNNVVVLTAFRVQMRKHFNDNLKYVTRVTKRKL